MQNPTDQAETSIPTETVMMAINGPNLNRTFTVRRKAAKRSEPWYPQNLAAPLSIPARKKPRLEEPLATTTDEYARKTASSDTSVGLPAAAAAAAADNDDTNANAEPVTDTQSNPRATRVTASWTLDEDEKLTYAVTNTCRKKYGKEHRIDWVAVAALVPGRTKRQCHDRWRFVLDPSIALTAGSTGKWTSDEDLKLKAAVQMHGGKHWAAIAAMVPGRTKKQCNKRWRYALDPSFALTAGRTGVWTEDEDLKLKAAVQTLGGKNWNKIAALVPGRTVTQCYSRWHDTLDPSIAVTTGSAGKWTAVEDNKLIDAIQTHGDKDWAAIATLVPGRTKKKCRDRRKKSMDPNRSTVRGK
jgi:hypothetical protein